METPTKRPMGRPPGSKTKPKPVTLTQIEYDRLVAAVKAVPVVVEPTSKPDLIEQHIQRLFDIFENTNPPTPVSIRAGAMWKKIVDERAPSNAFNVNVNITPHTIPDKSLKEIVIDAHPMFVSQIFDGLRERMERHEFTHESQDLARCLQEQFELQAAVMYAPPK